MAVSAPRAAFSVIVFILIIFIVNISYVLMTPQVMLWYNTALAFGYYPAAVELGLKVYQVFEIIILGGSAVYLAVNMLASENDSVDEWGRL